MALNRNAVYYGYLCDPIPPVSWLDFLTSKIPEVLLVAGSHGLTPSHFQQWVLSASHYRVRNVMHGGVVKAFIAVGSLPRAGSCTLSGVSFEDLAPVDPRTVRRIAFSDSGDCDPFRPPESTTSAFDHAVARLWLHFLGIEKPLFVTTTFSKLSCGGFSIHTMVSITRGGRTNVISKAGEYPRPSAIPWVGLPVLLVITWEDSRKLCLFYGLGCDTCLDSSNIKKINAARASRGEPPLALYEAWTVPMASDAPDSWWVLHLGYGWPHDLDTDTRIFAPSFGLRYEQAMRLLVSCGVVESDLIFDALALPCLDAYGSISCEAFQGGQKIDGMTKGLINDMIFDYRMSL
ncbi:hypothetical protein OE88DRAFT_549303 [Heliocybe sulcata]|uniref:Uncharacterized protein n=1 Tax=Heliocybe sulcata TaxID=5364 RepID=A0A5C3MUL4_9AGAM|nr:hypothetical protein OE88DRAFT_549303 [Heliocybe sulcata]